MPRKALPGTGHLQTGRQSVVESGQRVHAQREALQAAKNLLKPGEIAGDYDAARMLGTTLGGRLRAITAEDLRTFAASVRSLGKKFTGGITAKQVIDLSAAIDRERANEQIRTAVPVAHMDGVVHFVTNAGPESDVTRHHVYVEFLNFSAVVASPAPLKDLAKELAQGRIRWRCDCGRFTYWYGYIATVGQFIYGDKQVNFPKIRNPHLTGVACKHGLRVMQQLASPMVRLRLEKLIEDGRKDRPGKVYTTTKKDAQAMAALQTQRSDWKRNTVESAGERSSRLAQQRAAVKATAKAQQKEQEQAARRTEAQKARAVRGFEASLQRMVQAGALSAEQAAAMRAQAVGRRAGP